MVAVRTDVGTKYKQNVTQHTPSYAVSGVRMEDAHAAREVGRGRHVGVVVCVADGHGSFRKDHGVYIGGRECADAACETAMRLATCTKSPAPLDIFSACQRAVLAAIEKAKRETDTEGTPGAMRITSKLGRSCVPACGTTLTVAMLRPHYPSTFSWVGDSLGVLVRGDECVPLGTRHSVSHEGEVERMRESGVVVREGYYEYHVAGSKMRIAIARSLGHEGHPGLTHRPETVHFTPRPGDRVVVATDGLWDTCTLDTAGRVIAAAASEEEACDALVKIANSSRLPRDNVTVVCVFLSAPRVPCMCSVQ